MSVTSLFETKPQGQGPSFQELGNDQRLTV